MEEFTERATTIKKARNLKKEKKDTWGEEARLTDSMAEQLFATHPSKSVNLPENYGSRVQAESTASKGNGVRFLLPASQRHLLRLKSGLRLQQEDGSKELKLHGNSGYHPPTSSISVRNP